MLKGILEKVKENTMGHVRKDILVFVLTLVAIVLLFVIVMNIGTIVKFLSMVHSNWGALVGTFGALLFSVVNIGIWLYQSRVNTKAMKRQVILQEQLKLITELQTKLFLVCMPYQSYLDFKNAYKEAFIELKRWQFGVYEHLFKNDLEVFSDAYYAMNRIDEIWEDYNPDDDHSNWEFVSNIYDEDSQYRAQYHLQLIKYEQPLLRVIQFYREQIET